jgi:ferric-dicitrate binding protein FerR (iron transport regulator)
MANQQPIDDALLGKFLAGETDPDESARVTQWLAAQDTSSSGPSPADFNRFERIWQAATLPDQPPVDTDAAWQKIQQKLKTPNTRPASEPGPVVRPMPIQRDEHSGGAQRLPGRQVAWYQSSVFRLAAMLLLTIGIGWQAYRFFGQKPPANQPEQFLTLTTTDKPLNKILPDGTKILLNRRSTLRYPAQFANDHRNVTLTGEAFFDVVPDATRPFRIQARQTTVQVLGTSFSVRAYDANVSVAVKTGKVKFAGGRKAVLLTKDQQATFVASTDTIRQSLKLSANAFAYKTGQLVFDNEPLRNVVQTLNEVYNADVRLQNAQLGNCRLTTRFSNASLEAVVAVTAETLGLRVRHMGQQVILDGTCQ